MGPTAAAAIVIEQRRLDIGARDAGQIRYQLLYRLNTTRHNGWVAGDSAIATIGLSIDYLYVYAFFYG